MAEQLAQQPLQQQPRSSTSGASSFKVTSTSSRVTATGGFGGGGPIRATRFYGLKSSPSTPILTTNEPVGSSRRLCYGLSGSPATGVSQSSGTSSISGLSSAAEWWSMETTAMGSSVLPTPSGRMQSGKISSFRTNGPPTSSPIRRSASFDTIATSYLSGRWPHHQMGVIDGPQRTSTSLSTTMTSLVSCPIVMTFDKFTQTPTDFDELEWECGVRQRTPVDGLHQQLLQRSSQYAGTDNHVKSNKSLNGPLTASGCSKCIAIPTIAQQTPLVPCQGSAEGFNQEIEGLVRSGKDVEDGSDISKIVMPDGHRAPIADQLLRMRSVDTQTPSGLLYAPSTSDRQFPRIRVGIRVQDDDSPVSTLPIIPGDDCDEDSISPEPDGNETHTVGGTCSSPRFVCFVNDTPRRPPPDGSDQTIDNNLASESWCDGYAPTRKPHQQLLQQDEHQDVYVASSTMTFHIPSERSAFCPLLTKYIGHRHGALTSEF